VLRNHNFKRLRLIQEAVLGVLQRSDNVKKLLTNHALCDLKTGACKAHGYCTWSSVGKSECSRPGERFGCWTKDSIKMELKVTTDRGRGLGKLRSECSVTQRVRFCDWWFSKTAAVPWSWVSLMLKSPVNGFFFLITFVRHCAGSLESRVPDVEMWSHATCCEVDV
jgi:hypothetical protein